MPEVSISMALFARFYEATPPAKVRVVREIRSRATDPDGYIARDYYGELRSTIRATHWGSGSIDGLAAAISDLVADMRTRKRKVSLEKKAEHYELISGKYLDGWVGFGAGYFPGPRSSVQIGNLRITVNPDLGMRYADAEYAVKLWLNAPRPTRQFRATIQHLMTVGRGADWDPAWAVSMWDVRRGLMLPPVAIHRDFGLALESQAAAFDHIYTDLQQQATRPLAG